MQLAEGIDSDWLSKWQKSAGSFGVQAERNKLATTQADVSRGTDDATERINEAYFDSYGFFGIHREMISDKASSYMLLTLHRMHAWCCNTSTSNMVRYGAQPAGQPKKQNRPTARCKARPAGLTDRVSSCCRYELRPTEMLSSKTQP